ncbi:MAG: Aspartyl/glutamyl-tRNA(Asn/Gln) amidotransferase subunit C [Candidatus Curtissbacteria bacterium GW2011_GWC1_44_33]|uniref:Aspartyl/glutamyl-tRNA(Asn/Gln) amidotransferase subunit C n=1 Tax=Candidatus Curtissbacteria bacterium GW2011_GWC1_44_33 TaxID=1618413 RepID=A0A0G1LE39_9BACT|nr:MAG: Aspartyl/glutamyl-tRNA(Asn/Gln) amidotransferase subunit C [Candidatus Curtissbacteria bacterium GW2011_GWC1_44_33]
MDKEKVLNLAKLARIEIGNEEAESLSHEFDAILGYVGEVKSVTNNSQLTTDKNNTMRNVMREDANPHESGIYTEKMLEQAPAREGNYIKVKKIL